MRLFCSFVAIAVALAGAALTTPAGATFSIVAADTDAGAIGSAGASCVPYEVIQILRVAPGRGLLVGQAYFDDDALAAGEQMLAGGAEPAAVLAAVTDSSAHPLAPKMQYGIVDAEGRTASSTGPEANPYASDATGSSGAVAFTVQGNLLTGPAVLEGMASAAQDGCDLPERLIRALEAAGTDGGGDARCTDGGISAASAYLLVQWQDGTELRISLPDLRPEDPVAQLRAQLAAWRAEHPCPSPEPAPDDATGGGTDTGMSGGCAVQASRHESNSVPALLAVMAVMAAIRARPTLAAVSARRAGPPPRVR
ncbi:DUF1028 domain-containing protein [Polyangium jinanense]|uniref:DUF1028 domain-containing protein n=1 Tax=Polyangium jinanense TaxID=2829994 RepID=A0A9X3XE90_9BACT|nr:DUF1028 domain-containing protein [Polyangium jinanense]MDC3988697.1 DUF1028 domain-containing protein [Polyangium jinanense]